MKTILNLESDFPFTMEDFIQEFSVYQDRYDVLWFEDVSILEINKFYSVEILMGEITVVGFRLKENEFYIGTFESVWYLIANAKRHFFSFKDIQNSSIASAYKLLKTESCIPDDIIYSIIRLEKIFCKR